MRGGGGGEEGKGEGGACICSKKIESEIDCLQTMATRLLV